MIIPLGRAARMLAGLRPGHIDLSHCTTNVLPLSMLQLFQAALEHTAVALPETPGAAVGDQAGPKRAHPARRRPNKGKPKAKSPSATDSANPTPTLHEPNATPPLTTTPVETTQRGPTVLEDDAHEWSGLIIPRHIWPVLLVLRGAGHETFVVGGSVRDLVMGSEAKDLDLVTTATLHQISRLLRPRFRTSIVGRKFPIAIVNIEGQLVEISSMASSADGKQHQMVFDTNHMIRQMTKEWWRRVREGEVPLPSWAHVRRKNALQRDFTVNALMYEPFSRLLYDYCGGVADCQTRTLRTVGNPEKSFQEDPVRMVRAIRVASRLKLNIHPDTAEALSASGDLVSTLNQHRVYHEMWQMLPYGAAAAALELMWRFNILQHILPYVDEYFREQGVPRNPLKPSQERMLLMLRAADASASVQQPLRNGVVVAIIALPIVGKKLFSCDHITDLPQLRKIYRQAVHQVLIGLAPLGGRAVGVARDLLLGLGDGLPQAPEDNKPGAAVEASEGVLASEEGAAVEASEGVVSGRGKSAASRVAPPQNAQGDVEVDDTPSIPAWVVHWRVRLVELACLSTESWGHNMEALLQHSSGFKSEASDNL